jgi:hypothetical protein
MSDEEVIFEEAVDNLRESVQRLRATQSRLRSTGLDENPNYRDLSHRVRSALAMTEAAFMEARRRAEREGNRYGRTFCTYLSDTVNSSTSMYAQQILNNAPLYAPVPYSYAGV